MVVKYSKLLLFYHFIISVFYRFTWRAKSGVKMRHFVMVDFNKGINIIKHNVLKSFCIVRHSGTVLHVVGGGSSAHARNIPANMRDPKKL